MPEGGFWLHLLLIKPLQGFRGQRGGAPLFDYFREQDALKDYCEKINQSNLEISWFKDKVLRFEFESEDEFKKRKSFLSAG